MSDHGRADFGISSLEVLSFPHLTIGSFERVRADSSIILKLKVLRTTCVLVSLFCFDSKIDAHAYRHAFY